MPCRRRSTTSRPSRSCATPRTRRTHAIQRRPAAHPRLELHCTPTSSSWPTVVERRFAITTLDPLDQHRVGRASALADRHQPAIGLAVAECVGDVGDDLRSRHPQRAAERDRPAVDVRLLERGAGRLRPAQDDPGERLVDLEEVDARRSPGGGSPARTRRARPGSGRSAATSARRRAGLLAGDLQLGGRSTAVCHGAPSPRAGEHWFVNWHAWPFW
jgi:hypothetical protein